MLCIIVFLAGYLLVNTTGLVFNQYNINIDNTQIEVFDSSSNYLVSGTILNMPDTSENDYTLRVNYYDSNNNLLSSPTRSLRDANEWNISGRISFGMYTAPTGTIIDHVEVQLINSDGNIVGEASSKFNNDNVYSYD